MRRTAALALLVVLVTSCAGGSDVSGDRRVVGGVSVAFIVRPARAQPGKSVRLTLRLTNVSGNATELTFPTSQQYDFWVMRGSREVWRWSDERVFTQAVEHRMIGAQETITLAEPWVAGEPGDYVVHGEVKAEGYGEDLTGELAVG